MLRVLVEPSDFTFHNVGDMAMLQSAVARLARLWPDANIQVFTDEPERLRELCPAAIPLPGLGRNEWLHPRSFGRRVGRLQRSIRRWAPDLADTSIRLALRMRSRADALEAYYNYLKTVRSADVVIVSGMGGITDAFPDYAADVLEALGWAKKNGCYVAMVGQGIGPLANPNLRALAAKVLPQVDFIALREEVLGRPILRELGVPLDRVMTTGDDAIETAYNLRGDRLNWGLGLNARSSDYSDVDSSLLVSLRPDIRNAVVRHGTSIIPVPISTREDETDIDAIRTMAGNENIPAPFDRSNASPELVISQIKQCRLVVTGSYHAGVFAAALGVPVIGLAKSAYYMAKFRGLEAQFGSGCRTLALNRPEDVGTLSPTIDLLWENADALREELLSRAADQVLSIGRAYDRVGSDVEARRGPFQSERM